MKQYLIELWQKAKLLRGGKRVVLIIGVCLYVFILVISLVKINYTCLTPGTINPVSSVITVESDEETNPIYTISVYEYRQVTILHYWLSLLNPEVEVTTFDPETELSDAEDQYQGELMKKASITNSIIMAYVEAGQYNPEVTIDYTFNGLVVVGIDRWTDSDLHLGDIITKVEGTNVTSFIQFKTMIQTLLDEDVINMTLLRNELEVNVEVTVQEATFDGVLSRFLSLLAYEDHTIHEATPTYQEKASETTGPSGGLMQALAVYDAITAGDLTHGKRIMGTGTIDIDGTVGSIGGIKQKIITADLYHADYFFVPEENYDEAMEQYALLKNPSYPTPISVGSFADAVAFLEGLEG